MELRSPRQNPLAETRREAEESVDKTVRYTQIEEILNEANKPMSAKQIAVEMYKKGYAPTSERNFASPRLTELLKIGVVDCVGKAKCEYTNRNVGFFKLRKVERN